MKTINVKPKSPFLAIVIIILVLLAVFLYLYFSSKDNYQANCAGEGESIPVIQNPPECCRGLTLIKPKDPQLVGSSGFCTRQCGDSRCNANIETQYNCPQDCNL